jgi:nitrate reductase cytochrome c-type subunit
MTTADLSCTECHNDTNIISGKENTWSGSLHGSGTTTAYAGGRADCTGCHSGSGFTAAIAAGVNNADVQESADVNPSRVDCRACHQIHTSYTGDDWALTTTDPVTLFAFQDVTFDGGQGNMCANCHQPRTAFPEATDGNVKVTSTHWGAHHGPVTSMLMGVGGGGGVEGSPSSHVTMVENTCVACHMGEGAAHNFTPSVAACTACHADAENFDINGVQTEIETKLEEVKAALTANGLLDAEGTIVVGDYPEAQAAALWNYLMVEEDKSMGVHNPTYANAMLDAALEALK